MKIVRFLPEHLWQIRAQPEQVREVTLGLSRDYAHYLAQGLAYTATDGARVLGIAGVIETDVGVGTLWGVVAQDCRPQFLGMWRAVRRILSVAPFKAINTTTHFPAGCRALELLGFKSAGSIGDSEHILYVRTP